MSNAPELAPGIFRADAKIFGGHALGYRLANLSLHLVATAAVTLLTWRYSWGRRTAALVAGLVFALHPAHAEAVAWITGRVDLLATAAALVFWLGAEIFSSCGRACCVGLALACGLVCGALRGGKILGAVLAGWCAAALAFAVLPWQQAGAISQRALAALDRELAAAGPDALVLTAAPETFGPVWFWAWASPQCLGAPFLAHPVAPARVIERPVNYSRSDHWRAAPASRTTASAR